jgi:hypothetical protein
VLQEGALAAMPREGDDSGHIRPWPGSSGKEEAGELERQPGRWRGKRKGGGRPAIGAAERDRPATDLVSGVNSVFIQEQWVRERERMYLSPFFSKEETVFIS